MLEEESLEIALMHHQSGRLAEAEKGYRQVLAQQPNHPRALHLLGVLAMQSQQHAAAVQLIGRAISLDPMLAEFHCDLGMALAGMNQREQAIQAYQTALRIKPDFAVAHNNLGHVFEQMGRFEEATASYSAAVQISPQYVIAWNNLGNAFQRAARVDPAIDAYRQAVQHNPDFAAAWNNLGCALQRRGELDGAVEAFQSALRVNPQYIDVLNNLATAYRDQARIPEALDCLRRAIAIQPDAVAIHSNLLYTSFFSTDLSPRDIFEEHVQWAKRHASQFTAAIQPHHNDRNPDRRLRIGYVSPDFRKHPVSRFLLPLLKNRNREAVEVLCYADVPAPDDMSRSIQQNSEVWRDICAMDDAGVSDLIRVDRIDILVDLAGHSGNRLLVFARKPAPVQTLYVGYPDTTGLSTIDYRITDKYLDPGDAERDEFHTESAFRLGGTYWCYEAPAAAPEPGPLPASSAGVITFGCLNNFQKVSRACLMFWTRILREIPGSQLVLHSYAGSHQRDVRELLSSRQIDPDRVRFVGVMTMEQYFDQYRAAIDIALDPFPQNGGTTTCDALWMGVPVVTLPGQLAVHRCGASLLSNVGLPELIAQSQDEYVRIVRELAGDLPRLAELRSGLRQQMQASPLMDAPRFAADMEAAFRAMWKRWCATDRLG